jgi:hypothetical protein
LLLQLLNGYMQNQEAAQDLPLLHLGGPTAAHPAAHSLLQWHLDRCPGPQILLRQPLQMLLHHSRACTRYSSSSSSQKWMHNYRCQAPQIALRQLLQTPPNNCSPATGHWQLPGASTLIIRLVAKPKTQDAAQAPVCNAHPQPGTSARFPATGSCPLLSSCIS